MRHALGHRPSPAMVIATIALSLALAGTAIAGPEAITSALNKGKVKKIAKKQATKQIDKREAGLSVASAVTAGSAETAGSADSFGGMTATRIDPFTLTNGGSRELGTFGPFTLTASCAINQVATDVALVTITTNQNNSAFKGEDEEPDFDVGDTPAYVDASTPTGTPFFEEDGGAAIAPDGTELLGHQLYAGVNVFGAPGTCRFGGVIFAS